MSTASPSAKAPSFPAFSKPIDILQSQAAQLYANVHPVLLLSLLLVSLRTVVQDPMLQAEEKSFRPLVKNPVNTLLGLAPAVAMLQAVYCVLCLPYSGQAPPTTLKPGQKKKAAKPGQEIWARFVPACLSILLALTLTAPALYIIVVLFGAPLTTHLPHTALLATHLALLTTPQLFYAHGLEPQTWLQLVSLQLPVDEVYGMSLGACVGSWVGAIPIPLDWDREWQKWPVTIVVGMYAGAVVGKLVGGFLFKGWKVKIS